MPSHAQQEAARLERIARITEHRQAFYAECAAKYRPRTLLEQSLDRVPDTITTMCGGCGATFEQPFGGPLDCPACHVGEAAAQIEELTDKVASLESDAKSVERAEAEAQQHYEQRKEVQARLDKAIDLLHRAQGLCEQLDAGEGVTGGTMDIAERLSRDIDTFNTEG